MNVPYDLSNVLFVCTANTTDTIPEPLLNRMEVISFPDIRPWKNIISPRSICSRRRRQPWNQSQDSSSHDGALRRMIDEYTMESGVRDLKKLIDTLCRSAAVKLVRNEETPLTVTKSNLSDYLGHRRCITTGSLQSKLPVSSPDLRGRGPRRDPVY